MLAKDSPCVILVGESGSTREIIWIGLLKVQLQLQLQIHSTENMTGNIY